METNCPVNAAAAGNYFAESKEYYTKSLSNRDRVFGKYAEALGIDGPVTPELFQKITEHVTQEMGRSGKRAFRDYTFSCNKSCALARAYSHELADIISRCAVEAAIETVQERIEPKFSRRVHGQQSTRTGNGVFFAFNHHTARPSKKKNDIPDVQEHVHVTAANMTMCADGHEYAVDFGPTLQTVKEDGLVFQQKMFEKVSRYVECEMVDRVKGTWRIVGITREQELENSQRRKDIIEVAREKGVSMQEANLLSRQKKDVAPENYMDIMRDVHERYYATNEIQLHFKQPITGEVIQHERDITRARNAQRESKIREQISQFSRRTGLAYAPVFGAPESRTLQTLEEKYRVPLVRKRGLDDNRTNQNQQGRASDISASESTMLLSRVAVNRISRLQRVTQRDHYLRQARAEQARERLKRIDANTQKILSEAFSTNYAITVPTLRYIVRAANIDENLSDKELGEAIDRAHVIDIGRQLINDPRHPEREPRYSKDRFVTRAQNIEFAKDNIDRMKAGKGKIQNAMSIEKAQRLLDYVESDEGKRKHHAAPNDDFKISGGEQGAAVLHILTTSDRVTCVVGKAGTGKTTLCQRLKWIADESGDIELEGVCFTGKAAQGLQQESGIESSTLHSKLNALEKESLERWKPDELKRIENSPLAHAMKAVMNEEKGEIKNSWNIDALKAPDDGKQHIWIVDEAGLVDDNLMHYALIAAERTNHKLVLVGDPRQLQPVGAGAPMKKMLEEGASAAALVHARRQRKAPEYVQQSVEAASNGDVTTSLSLLDEHGCIKQIKNTTKRNERIAEIVTSSPLDAQKDNLVISATNANRKKLNKLIRSKFVESGQLAAGEEFKVEVRNGNKAVTETRHFAVGDRIICLSNDKKIGVMNGSMGTIRDFDEDGRAVIALDDGREVRFAIGSEYKALDYSYCVTDYKSQGMSVKNVIIDAPTKELPQYMQKYYVDISRTTNSILLLTDDKKALLEQVKVEQKTLSNEDFEFAQKIAERGVQVSDFYKSPLAKYGNDLAQEQAKMSTMDIFHPEPAQERSFSPDRVSRAAERVIDERSQEREVAYPQEHAPFSPANVSEPARELIEARSRDRERAQEQAQPQEQKRTQDEIPYHIERGSYPILKYRLSKSPILRG